MPKTVTLFMPVLNEAEGMRAILPLIKKEWCQQWLVVDGQSTDDTLKVAKEFGCDIYVQKKKGIRHAYIESFPMIKGDIVITFSPDGNCLPEAIPQLIEKINQGYDMVVASRYAPGAKSEDDDAITGFGNWMFTSSINFLHHGPYTDAMGIYRAYRTKLFYELDLDKEESYFTEKLAGTVMGIEPLLSVRAAKAGMRITEIASDEPKRMHGTRKLQIIRWGAAYMMQVFRETYFWRTKAKSLAAAKTST